MSWRATAVIASVRLRSATWPEYTQAATVGTIHAMQANTPASSPTAISGTAPGLVWLARRACRIVPGIASGPCAARVPACALVGGDSAGARDEDGHGRE